MAPCSIKWCGKNSKASNFKADGITFHRYPKDPKIKEKWINVTRRENWFPSEYSVICSRHFTQDCFYNMKNRRRLLSSAVPSLFLPLLVDSETATSTSATSSNPTPRILDLEHLERKRSSDLLSTLSANRSMPETPKRKKISVCGSPIKNSTCSNPEFI